MHLEATVRDISTFLFQVSASDSDAGINGTVRYNMSSKYFSIDQNTGRIVNKEALDREKVAKHTVIVTAVDGGNPVKVCQETFSWGGGHFDRLTNHCN